MTKRITALLWICIPLICFGQNIKEIKRSPNYIWGYGEANSLRSADRMALSQLVNSISVEVESKFESVVTEVNGQVTESVKSCINTYSSTSLQNTQKVTWEENGMQAVFRYIKKEELEKIFAAREAKIKDYILTGMEAEKDVRFGDAINNYYWALLLLRSHPDNQTMTFITPNGEARKLITAIPNRIESLLSDLKFKPVAVEHKKDNSCFVTLKATLNDKPVENLDYIYDMSGGSWSPLQSGRDGVVIAKYFGDAASDLERVRLRVECLYEHKAQVDKDIYSIVESEDFVFPVVENREFIVQLDDKKENEASLKKIQFETTETKEASQQYDYHEIIPEIVNAIKDEDYDRVRDYFDAEGWEVFTQLVKYGKAEPIPFNYELKTVTLNKQTYVRSVPMLFSFPNNSQSFVEKLVFVLNPEGKVSNLNFAISDNAINQLITLDERFGTEKEKFQLINFMEVYKTSYCLKRIEFIDSLFADNALIIVGQKVKKDLSVPNDRIPQYRRQDEYEFIQKTKGEYINSLKQVFSSNEFVNIHFDENRVIRANRNEKLYGIQIAQHYTSSSYADKGYLFLLIDLENKEEPKIYVRSWQPEKRADGSVVGVSDFIFN